MENQYRFSQIMVANSTTNIANQILIYFLSKTRQNMSCEQLEYQQHQVKMKDGTIHLMWRDHNLADMNNSLNNTITKEYICHWTI